jgi:hypothetical protein
MLTVDRTLVLPSTHFQGGGMALAIELLLVLMSRPAKAQIQGPVIHGGPLSGCQFDSSLKQFVEFGDVPVGDTGHAAQRTSRTRILEVRTLEVPRAKPVAVLQP